jgi:hypothetical protein
VAIAENELFFAALDRSGAKEVMMYAKRLFRGGAAIALVAVGFLAGFVANDVWIVGQAGETNNDSSNRRAGQKSHARWPGYWP